MGNSNKETGQRIRHKSRVKVKHADGVVIVSSNVMSQIQRLVKFSNQDEVGLNLHNVEDVITECFANKALGTVELGGWIRDNRSLYQQGLRHGFRTNTDGKTSL